ncbi:thiamine pyrophosphate-binding protein, partial [Nonomuraea sp. NPDC050643]|uniref:thiamine pyrophosphate-binding protein n=1 Tax=Nonomuraea sp. NPDC050643 TaxID=3155660 RepID=UPI0033CABE6B
MSTVSDAFSRVLRHHGVRAVFGNPGSNELSFLTGLPQDIPYHLALQEGAAIAMADGFAQASGTTGFLNLHAASGTGNAMGCLTNTASCHTPMVVLAGQQARRYVPVGALLTNVDPTKLCDPLVKWSGEPLRPQVGPALLSKGLLLCEAAPRGVVYLSVPLDDWDEPSARSPGCSRATTSSSGSGRRSSATTRPATATSCARESACTRSPTIPTRPRAPRSAASPSATRPTPWPASPARYEMCPLGHQPGGHIGTVRTE